MTEEKEWVEVTKELGKILIQWDELPPWVKRRLKDELDYEECRQIVRSYKEKKYQPGRTERAMAARKHPYSKAMKKIIDALQPNPSKRGDSGLSTRQLARKVYGDKASRKVIYKDFAIPVKLNDNVRKALSRSLNRLKDRGIVQDYDKEGQYKKWRLTEDWKQQLQKLKDLDRQRRQAQQSTT